MRIVSYLGVEAQRLVESSEEPMADSQAAVAARFESLETSKLKNKYRRPQVTTKREERLREKANSRDRRPSLLLLC